LITEHYQLAVILRDAGIDADVIARAGGGVWAFGSRAAGCAQPNSDWDVLVVAPVIVKTPSGRVGALDLVCVELPVFLADWQHSELATHIGAHGVCLTPECRLQVVGKPLFAAPRKRAVVHRRALTIDHLWDAFTPHQRRRESIRLRRDIQRVALLEKGKATPPSAWLDAAWDASSASERRGLIRSMALAHRIARATFLHGGDEIPW
jgi:hypothetical protein